MSGKFVTRRVVGTLVLLASVVAVGPARAGQTFCGYDPLGHTVSVEVYHADSSVSIFREGDEIRISLANLETVDCGDATRFNTDVIVVNDDSNHDLQVQIALNKPFRPGATGEEGTSDEIEFSLNLGDGVNELNVLGSPTKSNSLRAGTTINQELVPRSRVNLNANEQTGIDADVIVESAVNTIYLEGGDVEDQVRGDGGLGTGGASLIAVTTAGAAGADVLKGGEGGDVLYGGDGHDRGSGGGGPDLLRGQRGSDTLRGGDFNDTLEGGPGDDALNGGVGIDTCDGGRGTNTEAACEK